MSGLTEQDREALGDWWDSDWPDDAGGALGTLNAVVEQIVAAALTAAATRIEAARDAYLASGPLPDFLPSNHADAERTGRLVGLEAAARLVRDLSPG